VNNKCAYSCHFERSEAESRNLLFNRFLHVGLLRNPMVEMTRTQISSTIGITMYAIRNTKSAIRKSPQKGGSKSVHFCQFLHKSVHFCSFLVILCSFFTPFVLPILPIPYKLTLSHPFFVQKQRLLLRSNQNYPPKHNF